MAKINELDYLPDEIDGAEDTPTPEARKGYCTRCKENVNFIGTYDSKETFICGLCKMRIKWRKENKTKTEQEMRPSWIHY